MREARRVNSAGRITNRRYDLPMAPKNNPSEPSLVKVCTKCGEVKPLTEYYRHSSGSTKLRSDCKACRSSYGRLAYTANRELRLAAARTWYLANKAAVIARANQWQKEHRERRAVICAASFQRHHAARIATNKKWQAAHPEVKIAANARRRARLMGAPGKLTIQEWRSLKALWRNRCAYCGSKPKRLTQDHVIPLINGGEHSVHNVVPACQPCNSQKRTSPPPVPVQLALV